MTNPDFPQENSNDWPGANPYEIYRQNLISLYGYSSDSAAREAEKRRREDEAWRNMQPESLGRRGVLTQILSRIFGR